MVNPNTKRLWVHLTGPQHVNPLPRRCHPCSISEQNLQQIAGAKFRALALISLAPSLPVDHFELSACMHACMHACIHSHLALCSHETQPRTGTYLLLFGHGVQHVHEAPVAVQLVTGGPSRSC